MKVVGAIIRNHAGEFLLQLRDDNAPTFKNCWTLFGGHVEDDESIEQALLRELDEEISLRLPSIESLRKVQTNLNDNGIEQYIYEVMTNVSASQLVLNEGAAMKYVTTNELFDRSFAFNIETVLRQYLKVSR
ncbi:MAG: NUDIX domain-containing protein [Candidatus Saccharimonas sp.]